MYRYWLHDNLINTSVLEKSLMMPGALMFTIIVAFPHDMFRTHSFRDETMQLSLMIGLINVIKSGNLASKSWGYIYWWCG